MAFADISQSTPVAVSLKKCIQSEALDLATTLTMLILDFITFSVAIYLSNLLSRLPFFSLT